jgi:hypothetical protein
VIFFNFTFQLLKKLRPHRWKWRVLPPTENFWMQSSYKVKKMKYTISNGVFTQTYQSDWRICKVLLVVTRCHFYFYNFNLITLIIKNKIILITNLKNRCRTGSQSEWTIGFFTHWFSPSNDTLEFKCAVRPSHRPFHLLHESNRTWPIKVRLNDVLVRSDQTVQLFWFLNT